MKKIKRRDFIKSIGVSLVGGSILTSNAASSDVKTQFKWKMVTSWPKNFPGLGVGAENLAKIINPIISVKTWKTAPGRPGPPT